MEAAAAESRRAGGGCGAGGGALGGRAAANQPGPTFLTGHPARESPASSAQELARGRTRRPPPVGPALHPRVSLVWPGDFPPPPPQ